MTIYRDGNKTIYERLHTWRGKHILKHNSSKWEVVSHLMPKTIFDTLGGARTAIELFLKD